MILYGLVAHRTRVLAEYSPHTGDFVQVAHRVVAKLPLDGHSLRKSFSAGSYTFHVIGQNYYVFMCLVENGSGIRVPFAFLAELQRSFEMEFGLQAERPPDSLLTDARFSPVLRQTLEKFSRQGGAEVDKTKKVQLALETVKESVRENIDKVLARGEQLDTLVDRSHALNQRSQQFRRAGVKLRRHYCMQNVKLFLTLGVVALVLLLMFVVWMCGGISLSECRAPAVADVAAGPTPATVAAPTGDAPV